MSINELEIQINDEIKAVSEKMNKMSCVDCEDFDLRGKLYDLAFKVAPLARQQDIKYLMDWINPQIGEKSVDVAAGTGFVTKNLARWTGSEVIAVDPSEVQLSFIKKTSGSLPITTILGSPTNHEVMKNILDNTIDIITSYGGIHHITENQDDLFKEASRVLKSGGRFVAGDVGANSTLSKHFETSVKRNCLTSHKELWLSEERLRNELLKNTDLIVKKIERINVQWVFNTEKEMALFMKALHAYDMTLEEILKDLKDVLGYEKTIDDKYALNWPMLFFELEKK